MREHCCEHGHKCQVGKWGAKATARQSPPVEQAGLKVTDATRLEDLVRAEICIRAVVHADKVLEDASKAELAKEARTALELPASQAGVLTHQVLE